MSAVLRRLTAGLTVLLMLAGPVAAGEIRNFDRNEFAYAQHNGNRVMVVVGSQWGSAGQNVYWAMETISRDMLYPDVVFFRVDYNRMKDVLRDLRVYQDSTVIVYRGTQERGRLSGDIDEDGMRRLLDDAR